MLVFTVWYMETVGRAFPCFRHGTDYILNLYLGPLAYYTKHIFYQSLGSISHPSITTVWQPISRYTAVGLLHIPLGIALSPLIVRLRFHR